MSDATCAVCLSKDGFDCSTAPYGNFDANIIDCELCGRFVVSRTAMWEWLSEENPRINNMKRAVFSHYIRLQTNTELEKEIWTTARIESFFEGNPALPSPAQQATNIIRLVGDAVMASGEAIVSLPPSFSASVGSPSALFANRLTVELVNRGYLNALTIPLSEGTHIQDVISTLSGWELYEQEKQGQLAGSYGFVALKFGDPVLDPLLSDHIKPSVQAIGYELIDLRDVARAGVIDNLLRMQIRDAAFVLVDLTHENAGAYWEAGYAEGLGKPVLYLCEKKKFEEKRTHFDTNHCTTVLWSIDAVEAFKSELVATIRRSLAS